MLKKTKMKIYLIVITIIFLPLSCFSGEEMLNKSAPYFKVRSGDDKELTLKDLEGKVTVLFYETKGTIEENRKLKDELNRFYDEQKDSVKQNILRIAVVNCRGVIFVKTWKKELIEHSKKEGITIYGDWKGEMASRYCVKDQESNFMIIDKKGILVYFAAGKIQDQGVIDNIKQNLNNLIKE
jgi:peroxiredoxin